MSYNVGDFIQFERSHVSDTVGVIVSKWVTYNHDIYMVSIPQYKGDYLSLKEEHINGISNISHEEKLSLLGSFGDWWYGKFKTIYQSVLIETLK